MTSAAFYFATGSFDYLLLASPQYFLFYAFALIFGDIYAVVAAANVANFILAITGSVYICRHAPPVAKKTRGLIFYTAITLLLAGLAGWSYKHFRTLILPTLSIHEIIRDERGRHDLNFGIDTDLTEYVPFQENNKLVKIESPTLLIDSEYPTIHGAFGLYPLYAAAVEAIYNNANLILAIDHRHWNTRVAVGTSPQAFEALLDENKQNRSDMIFMLRPSEKQLQEAEAKGVELVITSIGYEAFVFFVSVVNPVDGLSLEQIRDIYSKRTTHWDALGGRRERILPFQRPEGSGSQTAMLRVMGGVPMAPPQLEEFRPGMGGIVRDVADYRNYGNAIGFSFRYYVEGLFKHDGVKLLEIDGIAPSIANIQNRSYPLIGELVIISRRDNENPNVQRLTDWFLSSQGQELVRDVGYVPLE
ncbi:MAG: substrate-binding domain-containing protein [Planctomycetaceae bacterium]|nr:substrate-binding domain-containing protein [Planctomycetaceae bacterium]